MAVGNTKGPTSVDDSAVCLTMIYPPGDRTLPTMLKRQAKALGDYPLAVFPGKATWSYAEAADIAARSARRLSDAGVKYGDRVALMAGNRPEFLEIYLGCAWLGAIAVPINVASRGAQLAHILKVCGSRLMAIESGLVPSIATVEDTSLELKTVWTIDTSGPDGASPGQQGGTSGEDRWTYERLPDLPDSMEPGDVSPSDTVAILFTSGTTGPSKGVCCPQAQYFWWAYHSSLLLGVRERDVLLTPLPLFHTNALNTFYQALVNGATIIAEERFSVSRFMSSLVEHKATVTYLLGAMIPMLLSRDHGAVERAHQVRISLAPAAPAELQAQFRDRLGIDIVDGYGSTETNFVIGATPDQNRPGSMGLVRPGFEARVVDEQDNEVPAGVAGELVLRASEPFAFAKGYFGMPEKTVEAWRNLWFHTGDRVVADEVGYYRFIDRMKEAIRRRGENISSFEVEQVILNHPAVAGAAVFPVGSELAEDEVMAAVVLKEGAELSPKALLDYCQPRMPYFAVPRFVDFLLNLPLTENGKIRKFELQKRGVAETTWDREKAGYEVARVIPTRTSREAS